MIDDAEMKKKIVAYLADPTSDEYLKQVIENRERWIASGDSSLNEHIEIATGLIKEMFELRGVLFKLAREL